MTINLITFISSMNKATALEDVHDNILTQLNQHFQVNIIPHTEQRNISPDEFNILFIASGGVERMVIQDFEQLPRPVIMLADGLQNSLAASLEISSWLRGRGIKSEILHGEPSAIIARLKILYDAIQGTKKLVGSRIGVFGSPSSWLISSNVDYFLAKRRWGIDYIDIPLEKVYAKYNSIDDEEVGELSAEFAGRAIACREGTPEDLLKAMRLYRALKLLCEENKLDALTLSCFDMLKHIAPTGCLALSLLTDEDIMAGCEGDAQSIFTMLSMKALTGKSTFMANPSSIDREKNEVIFAHCTVGIKQTESYIIRNHFESLSSIAIQGILPAGRVTVIRCGGEALDEYYLSAGTIIENTDDANMCRTQIRVKLDRPTDYFFRNPLGNHHIIIRGEHTEVIKEFMHINGCKRIE
ncbi:fucose isomerase [Bacteroides sp. 214]|uniref:fucose isomerase n=1 Tax=Bacteroides sp. 214 TaxID=2302935 RepID=UPI0013D32A2B|nr:fucose isomerase [Bacteroides sp. 214]NDW11335.1 fucose isomerase [Bacteroides sp. 214]